MAMLTVWAGVVWFQKYFPVSVPLVGSPGFAELHTLRRSRVSWGPASDVSWKISNCIEEHFNPTCSILCLAIEI